MLLIFRWPRGRRAAGRGHVYTLVAGDDHRPPARGFLPVCAHIQGVRRLRRRACLAVGVCAKSAFLPRGPRCARPGGRSGRGGRNRPPPPQLLLLRTRKAGRDAGAGFGPHPASPGPASIPDPLLKGGGAGGFPRFLVPCSAPLRTGLPVLASTRWPPLPLVAVRSPGTPHAPSPAPGGSGGPSRRRQVLTLDSSGMSAMLVGHGQAVASRICRRVLPRDQSGQLPAQFVFESGRCRSLRESARGGNQAIWLAGARVGSWIR